MEQNELFGPSSVLKPRLEDDEWSLQVVILPLQGLFKSLQGTFIPERWSFHTLSLFGALTQG